MKSPDTQSGTQSTSKSINMEVPMDWRPQAIRLFSILVVIVGHMLFTANYLENDARHPLVWFGGFAIGAFIMCSGYVHGLKDEFNKPGSLNRSTYVKFFKKRFFRLYIGYYLAIIVVFIAKFLAGYTVVFSTTESLTFGNTNPIHITPLSLILDITCMWPLLTANLGGIWGEGWFVCVMIILSLTYPLLRKLYSINKYYLYLVIIISLIIKFYVILDVNANYAYYFPFAWTAEFSFGIIIGDRICKKGSLTSPSASYQNIIIAAAGRVWPLYLFHMAAVVFMWEYAPLWLFFVITLIILILAEIFYRILKRINEKLGVKRKGVRPIGELY